MALRIVLAAGLVALAAACGGRQPARVDLSVTVPADQPPSAASWPPYPAFDRRSCWTRRIEGAPLRAAPSSVPPATGLAPTTIAELVLARFGDRRYIRHVAIGPPPPVALEHLRGYFAGVRPPANARWAYVSETGPAMAAQWEGALVLGALRDDFCAAGGAPLVGWTVGRGGIGVSDSSQALEQRFPNPSAATFRSRVQLVGRRYGFTVDQLLLLHPRQLAPLLVVRTERDRTAFVHDVPAIMRLLDPIASGKGPTAITFEGFFLEAADAHGPFVRVENVYRGQVEGGEWSWSRCVYPYAHSEPAGAKPCP
jgi:hypothetical protein